jgi:glutathione S-transferase
MPPELTLYTFAVSHFSEKIRWILDAAGLHYEERRLTPFFHLLHNRRLTAGRSNSVPILQAGDEVVADSTRIIHWLERHHRKEIVAGGLVPANGELRERVLQIEDRFDRVGAHVIRYVYGFVLDDREEVLKLWCVDASFPQWATLRFGFPLLRTAFHKGFNVNPESCARSRKIIGEALVWLEQELADGREFLVGNNLTVADIAVCALLAPLATPVEHLLYCSPRYRDMISEQIVDWSARPGIEWVRRTYSHWRYPLARRYLQRPAAVSVA